MPAPPIGQRFIKAMLTPESDRRLGGESQLLVDVHLTVQQCQGILSCRIRPYGANSARDIPAFARSGQRGRELLSLDRITCAEPQSAPDAQRAASPSTEQECFPPVLSVADSPRPSCLPIGLSCVECTAHISKVYNTKSKGALT